MPDTSDFYYAELSFSRLDSPEQFEGLDRTEVSEEEKIKNTLEKFIRTGELIHEEGKNEWYFGQNTDTGRGFIIGRFGKEFSDRQGGYDEDSGQFVDEEGTDASQSWFIIHPGAGEDENCLIAYNQGYRLKYKEFVRAFYQGYNRFTGEQILSENILYDDREISEALDEASRILKVGFELEPTNPGAREEFEELDERIKEMNADKGVDVDARSSDSINMEEELLSQARHMSEYENGEYGELDIVYIREDGEKTKYESKKNPVTYEVEKPSSLDDLQSISEDIIREGTRYL